jgi:hypothetical protein
VVSIEDFRQMALSFPDAVEKPHFELTSFRIRKGIFATLDIKNNRACLMMTPKDQSVFSAFDNKIIYAVPNKWGLKGATYVDLKKVRKSICRDGLKAAFENISTKK